MFGIYSPGIYTNFLPLFLSIALCLEANGYKVYFIEPNVLQKHQLKKYKINSCENNNDILKKLGIQKILIWNGVFHDIKIPEIQNYYFENGYFGNDLQVFKKGVNAQSEIAKLNYKDFLKYKASNITQDLKYSELVYSLDFTFYNYGILGFFSQSPLLSIRYFSKIIQNFQEKIKRKNILKNIESPEIKKGKYVLIGFQVHDDTQIFHNSPYIKKMEDILEFFYTDIQVVLPNHKLIVKEHPMDIGRTDYSVLRKKYPDIIWVQKGDISQYIDQSEYIICVNSSIGLQALEKYKKVLTLGENFYSKNPWVKNIHNKQEFSQKLLKLKKLKISESKRDIDKYIEQFKKEVFISNGGWKSFDSQTIQSICQRLL